MDKKYINPFHDTTSLPPIAENQLPADSDWLFPEYRFHKMNLVDYAGVIIERILEKGSCSSAGPIFSSSGLLY